MNDKDTVPTFGGATPGEQDTERCKTPAPCAFCGKVRDIAVWLGDKYVAACAQCVEDCGLSEPDEQDLVTDAQAKAIALIAARLQAERRYPDTDYDDADALSARDRARFEDGYMAAISDLRKRT